MRTLHYQLCAAINLSFQKVNLSLTASRCSEGYSSPDNLGGLIFGGAYTWRGLFSEFYGMQRTVFD